MVEIRADDCRLLQSYPVIANQIGHPARRVDFVVWAVDGSRQSRHDLDAVLQQFFENHDPCHPRIGRAGRDVEFHRASIPSVATSRLRLSWENELSEPKRAQ